MIIIAPPAPSQIAAPKVPSSLAPPRLDWLDEQLLEHLRSAGTCKTWTLLNAVVNDQCPRDRADGRRQRLCLLERLRCLRKLGLVFPTGRNGVSATKPDPTQRQPAMRRRRRTVARSASVRAGSGATASKPSTPEFRALQAWVQVIAANRRTPPPPPAPAKTKSVPDPAQVAQAARSLARLPRNQPRRLTGWLHGEHCWRGRLLVLADGEIAPLLWCSRGRVLLRNHREMEWPDFLRWGGRREPDVRFHKCPEAVLLGSLKAGVKERPSRRKQEAARRNGLCPCRPGKARGRPRVSKPMPMPATPR